MGFRRGVLFGLVTLLVAALPAPAALAAPNTQNAASDALAAAQARITDAQAAADRAAVEFDAAQARAGEISNEITRARTKVDSLKRQQARLAAIARARAIRAYKGGIGDALDALLGSGTDALESARRVELLNRANARGDEAIDRLQATSDDLSKHEASLRTQLREQKDTIANLNARQEELQGTLRDATVAANQLRAELERQRRAADYVKFVQKAREAARARALASATTAPKQEPFVAAAPPRSSDSSPGSGASESTGGGGTTRGPGQIIGSGSWICPVQGPVAFTDTYGSPREGGRTHKGVDMFSPRGTPVVAVMAGSVFFQGDPAGGNAAYLQAGGNTYYYAHLDHYVGSARNVAAGEVIGTVGNTGTNDAPTHLHFEIRIGGPNGTRINPYATVAAHC